MCSKHTQTAVMCDKQAIMQFFCLFTMVVVIDVDK